MAQNLTTDDTIDFFSLNSPPEGLKGLVRLVGDPAGREVYLNGENTNAYAAEVVNPLSPALSGIPGTADGQIYSEAPTVFGNNRYRWFATGQVWILFFKGIKSATDPASAVYVTLNLSSSGIVVGDTVQMQATPTSAAAPIASVAFYNGNIPLGTITQQPYILPFHPTTAGRYSLSVVATDQAGQVATSSPKALDVAPVGATPPPAVQLTVPSTGILGQSLPLTATATAGGTGTIVLGEFLLGLNVLATTTTPPFATTYTPTTTGYLTFSFRATDSSGKVNSVTVTTFISAPATTATPTGGGTDTPAGTAITPAKPTFANFSDTQSGGSIDVTPTSPLPLSAYVYALPTAPNTFMAVPSTGTIVVGNISGAVSVRSLPGTYSGIAYAASDVAPTPNFTQYTPPTRTLTALVIGGNDTVGTPSTTTYTLTGTYSDGSTGQVTSGIMWGSNTPGGVLTIASNSTATSTVVTASVGSVTAPSKTVTITAAAVSVPNAPTIGMSVAGNGTVRVQWTAASTGGAATSFNVYRNGGTLATATGITTSTASNGVTTYYYDDNGVTNGNAQTYKVSGVNSAGEGPKSAASAPVTPIAPTAPSFNTTYNPGDNKSTGTWSAAAGWQLLINFPLSTNTDPNPATMLVFAPDGTQIGQFDYNGADSTTVQFAIVNTNGGGTYQNSGNSYPGTAYYNGTMAGSSTTTGALNLTNGNVTLSA